MSDRIAVMSRATIRQIGTPSEIYDHPQNHFVASFVGDANMFRATLLEAEGSDARLKLGETEARITSFQTDLPAPGPVTLFVRPEHCHLAEPGTPGTIPATVALSVYQGSHTELHVDCPLAEGGRAMLRVPSRTSVAPGEPLAIGLAESGAAVFGAED